MRRRTVVALVGIAALAVSLVVVGVGGFAAGGSLTEVWISDTPRDNRVNHHAVGVGPGDDVIVAPVSEVPYSDAPITNRSCSLVRVHPDNGSTVWRNGMPADDCFTHALTQPAIEDIDDDGRQEVVGSTTEEALVVHEATTGRETYRLPLVSYGYGRPTLADFRPTAGTEIVTSDITGHVLAATAAGDELWRVSLNETFAQQVSAYDQRVSVYDAPAVVDVDADDRREVVVGTSQGVAVIAGNGSVEYTAPVSADDIVVAQADSDPAREIVVAASGRVTAIDGGDGSREWERSFSGMNRIRQTANPDGSGPTLYVGRVNGEVVALNAQTGETEWKTTVATGEDATLPPPVVADVTGDDSVEVITVTNSGRVAVLDAVSGEELARYERSVPIWTVPTPADIDDDSRAELLVRYGDGRVVALDYAGS